jgi:hypothetical protein
MNGYHEAIPFRSRLESIHEPAQLSRDTRGA